MKPPCLPALGALCTALILLSSAAPASAPPLFAAELGDRMKSIERALEKERAAHQATREQVRGGAGAGPAGLGQVKLVAPSYCFVDVLSLA